MIAVVGSCVPERRGYAARLAGRSHRALVPAHRLDAVPDPAAEAAELALRGATAEGAVAEFPSLVAMTDLIGALADPEGPARLTGVVCVADARHLLDDLARDSYATHPVFSRLVGHHVAHALLAVTQLEYASTIVLVNWAGVPTAQLATTMAVVSHLSPRARLRLDQGRAESWRAREAYVVAQDRPGWVALLNDAHDPHMTDRRVSAFRYENVRPFHPERLRRVLDDRIERGEFGMVVRSGGLCRLATRPGIVAEWNHVGRMISFDPLAADDDLDGDDEVLAIGQDLGVVGLDLDRAGLEAALDGAAITDDEVAAGPDAWARFSDPFPPWPHAEAGRRAHGDPE